MLKRRHRGRDAAGVEGKILYVYSRKWCIFMRFETKCKSVVVNEVGLTR